MTYWIMDSPVGPKNKSAEFLPYNDFTESWISGSELSKDPPNPIKLFWDPENEHSIKKEYYPSGPVLMKHELVQALEEVGVTAIDKYPVEICSNTNDIVCSDYVAVNIIGALAVANMEESMILERGGGLIDVVFGSLVIDQDKAKGTPLFRLAESPIAVLITEKVKNHLEDKGGFGLTFIKPSDFCG